MGIIGPIELEVARVTLCGGHGPIRLVICVGDRLSMSERRAPLCKQLTWLLEWRWGSVGGSGGTPAEGYWGHLQALLPCAAILVGGQRAGCGC